MKKSLFAIVSALLMTLTLGAGAAISADVDVYAEGAYTGSDLVLYIYADINGPAILSAGVKVTYPTSLTVTNAAKNESVWVLGSFAYMEPETGTPGEVVLILGKLDPAAPTAGVTGTRVLLGTIEFSHSGAVMPPAMGLDYGRAGNYDNFVATNGMVMDGVGVAFTGVSIFERGDANGDGSVNALDAGFIRNFFFSGSDDYIVYADCDGDGSINALDAGCIRDKFFGF